MAHYLENLASSVAVAATLTLRYSTFVFVRILPWSENLKASVRSSFVVYLLVLFYRRSKLWQKPSRARHASSSRWRRIRASASTVVLGSLDSESNIALGVCFALNAACVLCFLDFCFRGAWMYPVNDAVFQRLGYVNSSHAKVLVRSPQHGAVQSWLREINGSTNTGYWQPGPLATATSQSDYVSDFQFGGLQPQTKYEYRTDKDHYGVFTTPAARPQEWSFVASSCIKSFFPYDPLSHPLSIPGLAHLARTIGQQRLDFVLFLGDFIYIDLPVRHGAKRDAYWTAYRQVYASPSWTTELTSTPWLHTYDDHEFENNWSANESGLFADAIDPYLSYQQAGNPVGYGKDQAYYSFQHGDVSFFVLDTRRHRSPGSASDGKDKTMLGKKQRDVFEDWLRNAPGWKFVVSSVPFTKNFQAADSEDSWAGYLHERQLLLDLMWDNGGVVIISGDRHEHATTRFPSPRASGTDVIEFSTSPLSQFYPRKSTYRPGNGSEVAVFHEAGGLSKFGIYSFDTRGSGNWSMQFQLVIDGEPRWSHTVYQARNHHVDDRGV